MFSAASNVASSLFTRNKNCQKSGTELLDPAIEGYVAYWPVTSLAVMQQFGRDWVESGHRADIVDRSKMTIRDIAG